MCEMYSSMKVFQSSTIVGVEFCFYDLPINFVDTHPAVPIVPFTETQEEAFSNRNFKKLLRSLQLHPPSNEQVNN